MRLYDQTISQEVAGSTLYFQSLTSKESSSLTLVDGHRYKVQTEVDLGTCIDTGASAQSNDPNPGVPSGQVVSADLVLSQATTDPEGLVKTVGWYPSVTSAVDFSQDAQNLGFKLTAPQLALPNALAPTWEATVRRTGASGAAGSGMLNATTGTLASALATTTSGSYVDLSATGVTLPTATGSQLDTQTELATGTAGGRIASSLLRIAMSLRDLSAPQFLSALTASNPAFSPGVSIGSKDTTTLSATIKDFSPLTWTITIKDASNQVVRTQSVSNVDARNGVTASWAWDGKDDGGLYVVDGTYNATMSAVDLQGNASSSPAIPLPIVVDTVAPTITGYDAAPDPFSPNADGYLDTTTLAATLSESSSWGVQVGVTTISGSGMTVSVLWNGASVADGTHTGTLTATDAAGNSRVATTTVVRDTAGPTITSFAASNPDFSPGVSLGRKDTTVLTATVSDSWQPLDWVIEIKQGSTIVRSHSVSDVGSPANVNWTWDGSDNAGQSVVEGTYSATLRATDEGRNSRTSSTLTIRVDRTAPSVVKLTPADGQNTIYSSQPLQAEVIDQGTGASGINSSPSGVSFQLKNETTSVTTSWSATYSATTKIATSSSSPTLVDGQDYTLLVLAEDRAGNQIQDGHLAYRGASNASSGGFRKITLQTPTATSTIPATGCTVQTEGLNKVAVCSGAQAQLGNSSVTVSGSRHSFVEAFVTHSMPLEDAVLDWKVGGSTVATINAYDARVPGSEWNPRSVEYRYAIGDRASLPATLAATPDDPQVSLGTLRITLPSSWAAATNVELRMSSATENPQPDACSSPLTSSVICTTDPLWSRYAVVLDEAIGNRQSVIAQHEQLGAEVLFTIDHPDVALYEAIVPPSIRSTISADSAVTDMPPLRRSNLEDQYRQLLGELPTGSPTITSGVATWEHSNTGATQSLALSPGTYSRLEVAQEMDLPADAPPPDAGETTATPITDVIELRPAASGLASDSVTRVQTQRRVRYESNSYWIEVQGVGDYGLRFMVHLLNNSAPAIHDFNLNLPQGTELRATEGDTAVVVRQSEEATEPSIDPPLGYFAAPFAYDAQGRTIPIRQYITSNNVRLELDLSGDVEFPVIADPTYHAVFCESASMSGTAFDYMNDTGTCPYGFTFEHANSYWPQRALPCGDVTCGMRYLRRAGECSWYPDTGPWWDFQVPCKSHDYAWDLIRVKAPYDYPNVDRDESDEELYDGLAEHCSSRSIFIRGYCFEAAAEVVLGLEAAELAGLEPARGSRPSGPWPPAQVNRNTDWSSGIRYWTVGANAGGTVPHGVYTDDITGLDFFSFRCVSESGCFLKQTTSLNLRGGESFNLLFHGRCRSTAGCPITLRMMARRSDGVWVTLGSNDQTVPHTDDHVWVRSQAYANVPLNTQYTHVRWELINNSTERKLNVQYPHLTLASFS